MNDELEPADIFLTRGTAWVSRAIRFFSRRIGEPRTKANHVGVVVEGGSVTDAVVVEALSKVRRHRLARQYGAKKGTQVAVYRPLDLTQEERKTITEAAEAYVGRDYGWFQLIGHLFDWALQGAYVFRRLTGSDRYPICSWVVAHSYAKAGRNFGVAPGAATPDDICDFVERETEKYRQIRGFESIRPG
jgi:hypothetical protein